MSETRPPYGRYPKPGERWQHYKGGSYEVLHIGTFEPDLQPVVVYQDHARRVWVRPLAVWLENVGPETPRFRLLEDGTA